MVAVPGMPLYQSPSSWPAPSGMTPPRERIAYGSERRRGLAAERQSARDRYLDFISRGYAGQRAEDEEMRAQRQAMADRTYQDLQRQQFEDETRWGDQAAAGMATGAQWGPYGALFGAIRERFQPAA